MARFLHTLSPSLWPTCLVLWYRTVGSSNIQCPSSVPSVSYVSAWEDLPILPYREDHELQEAHHFVGLGTFTPLAQGLWSSQGGEGSNANSHQPYGANLSSFLWNRFLNTFSLDNGWKRKWFSLMSPGKEGGERQIIGLKNALRGLDFACVYWHLLGWTTLAMTLGTFKKNFKFWLDKCYQSYKNSTEPDGRWSRDWPSSLPLKSYLTLEKWPNVSDSQRPIQWVF